jgi:hypothetical protein
MENNMLEKLACNLGRKDEEPNIELAAELCKTKDKKGIKEIVGGLASDEEKTANDCIKVLYEIGEQEPQLIADYVTEFIQLLRSRNNRLVWGGMMALAKIASVKPHEIYKNIESVIKAYEKGSVITVDNSISVFAELVRADSKYEKPMFAKIIKHLETCRPKEVAQHAERAFVCVNKKNAAEFLSVLQKRREHLTDVQKKRIDKLIKKIGSWK